MSDTRRLGRLLDLRRHEEERRVLELALARQAVGDAQEALRRLREQREDIERALASASGESVGEIKTLRLLVEQLDRGIHNATTVSALAAATEAENEQRYQEARTRRESLERVIAPRVERAQALERFTERKQEDEMTLTRFRNGGSASS